MSSRSINKVILLGNLTRDPQVKFTTTGTAVATFAVATNRTWTTKDGQTQEDVQYHNIVAWNKLAELVGKILSKGRKVYLEGRLTSRKYTDKSNVERYITEVVMDDFIVLDSKFKEGQSTGEQSSNDGGQSTHEMPTENDIIPNPPKDSDTINPDDIPF